MNWKRGFKRITHVVAIVIAVACGVIAVYLPIQWRNDAGKINWDKYLQLEEAAREYMARQYGMSYDDYIQLERRDGNLPDGKSPAREVNLIIKESREHVLNDRFWYRLSTNDLIGIVVLYGLGGVVAGYAVTWVVLWAIVVFIHWLVLGFREDKPTNEQSNN